MRDKRIYRQKGRGGGARFTKLDEWIQKMPAWRALDPVARCIFWEMLRLYNGTNNGEIGLSCRKAGELVNVTKTTAARGIQKLVDHGFIRLKRPSGFDWKSGARQRISATYSLTHLPVGNALPTKDFVRWSPTPANVIAIPSAISEASVRPAEEKSTVPSGGQKRPVRRTGTG